MAVIFLAALFGLPEFGVSGENQPADATTTLVGRNDTTAEKKVRNEAGELAVAHFNNGCSLPDWDRVRVPKTKEALEIQLGKKFTVVRRGIFLIASDLDAKRFDYVVNGVFACCRELLQRQYFQTPPSKVVTVYLFAHRDSYVQGLREHFGMDPISPYGHYGHTKRYIVVNYATGPGTLVHEMTHALMAADFPSAPIWISEGIASLYEQCKVEDNRLLGEQNWRLPELQKAVIKGTQASLDTLFSCDTKNFRMMRESLNYAQSRYFCYYLQEKGVLQLVYTQFRDNKDKDPTGVRALESVLRAPLATIEKDWLIWLEKQRWEGSVEHTETTEQLESEAANANAMR